MLQIKKERERDSLTDREERQIVRQAEERERDSLTDREERQIV